MPHFHIVTLFPEVVRAYVGSSILGRAMREKKIKFSFYNPRDFTHDTWARVDKRPYGGGPGMVLEALPILKAAEKIKKKSPKTEFIFLSAGGKQFTNAMARTLSQKKRDLAIVAGHYEGVDARVMKILKAREISVGPYILTGGEAPAMIIVDAVARQIPGVLGNYDSVEEERVSSSTVYTRPEVLAYKGKKYRVPKVLLSGHHRRIEEWKRKRR